MIKNVKDAGIVLPTWNLDGRWSFSWEKDGVTTILTSRSSRILVSSFGRASNVQSEAETRSTFARQSEKRTKYARKNRPPLRCRTRLDQMGSDVDPQLRYFRSVSGIEHWNYSKWLLSLGMTLKPTLVWDSWNFVQLFDSLLPSCSRISKLDKCVEGAGLDYTNNTGSA